MDREFADDALTRFAAEGPPPLPEGGGTLERDGHALEGLFLLARRLQPGRLRDEMATFLVDAYTQAPVQTLDVLGGLDRSARAEVAGMLTEATVALFPGEAGHPQLPWPTRRVPRESLDGYARRGWDSLSAAEDGLRPAQGLAAGR